MRMDFLQGRIFTLRNVSFSPFRTHDNMTGLESNIEESNIEVGDCPRSRNHLAYWSELSTIVSVFVDRWLCLMASDCPVWNRGRHKLILVVLVAPQNFVVPICTAFFIFLVCFAFNLPSLNLENSRPISGLRDLRGKRSQC